MSRWWRKEIDVAFSPAQATLSLRAAGWRPRELARKALRAETGAHDAREVVNAIETCIASNGWRNADLRVTLCGGLVRYLLLPPVAKLGARDALVYARHAFAERYGDVAAEWTVCVEPSGAGRARIAAAADERLLDALRAVAKKHALNLYSVRPQICSAIDALDQRDRRYSGWLALIDSDYSCVARFTAGACTALRTARVAQPVERHLVAQLEHDALCGEVLPADRKLYLYTAANVDRALLGADGWHASMLGAGSSA